MLDSAHSLLAQSRLKIRIQDEFADSIIKIRRFGFFQENRIFSVPQPSGESHLCRYNGATASHRFSEGKAKALNDRRKDKDRHPPVEVPQFNFAFDVRNDLDSRTH